MILPMVLWVNPDPWIDPPQLGSDTWAGYATERTELANFIRDNRITNLVMASADMHALAYDDGTHSDYATGGGAAFPVLHAAALAQVGSTKGGPYTTGPLPGGAQYGILEVYDNGGPSVACRFQGFKVGEGPRLTEIFSSSLDTANNHALGNISTLAKLSPANDTITSGFVISGTTPRDVLVRAIGPTLAAFGLTDALARPRLSVRQGDTLVGSNEGWVAAERSAADLTAAFDRAGAFRLLDETSRDAALLLTLSPGAYTVQVKSADAGATGSVLLEVYDLP